MSIIKKKTRDKATDEIRGERDRAVNAAVALENRLAEMQARFDEVVEANRDLIDRNAELTLSLGEQQRENDWLTEKLDQAHQQIDFLERDRASMKEMCEGLRWRIYTLLKSTDVDAELFGMPKYTIYEPQTIEHTVAHDDLNAYLGRMADKYDLGPEDSAKKCKHRNGRLCIRVPGLIEHCLRTPDCGYTE